jgi:hypothetical protein
VYSLKTFLNMEQRGIPDDEMELTGLEMWNERDFPQQMSTLLYRPMQEYWIWHRFEDVLAHSGFPEDGNTSDRSERLKLPISSLKHAEMKNYCKVAALICAGTDGSRRLSR